MKLFVVHPGWIISKNDWEHHFISAHRLMDLYGVTPEECIVWDDKRTSGYFPEYLEKLTHLHPLSGLDYRRVTNKDREEIRARLGV